MKMRALLFFSITKPNLIWSYFSSEPQTHLLKVIVCLYCSTGGCFRSHFYFFKKAAVFRCRNVLWFNLTGQFSISLHLSWKEMRAVFHQFIRSFLNVLNVDLIEKLCDSFAHSWHCCGTVARRIHSQQWCFCWFFPWKSLNEFVYSKYFLNVLLLVLFFSLIQNVWRE